MKKGLTAGSTHGARQARYWSAFPVLTTSCIWNSAAKYLMIFTLPARTAGL